MPLSLTKRKAIFAAQQLGLLQEFILRRQLVHANKVAEQPAGGDAYQHASAEAL